MNYQIFLKRLKEKIDESGLTLAELAERAGVPLRSLKYNLSSGRLPKIAFLMKLQKVLKFEYDYLFQLGKYEL